MAETFFPFEAGAGAAVAEAQWEKMAKRWLSTGVIDGYLNELAVVQRGAGANKSVDVSTGGMWIEGHYYENDAVKNLSIADNVSGSTRIDRIVVRLDRAANTISTVVLQGTPGAGAPALIQTDGGVYEKSLAQVSVANGFASIVTANITDERVYADTGAVRGDAVDSTYIDTEESTTSTSYTDLATPGPAVTVPIGRSGKALVTVSADVYGTTSGQAMRMSYAISGATTRAADDDWAYRVQGGVAPTTEIAAGRTSLQEGLTPGPNTFTAKFKTSAGTAYFGSRDLIVIPL